MALRVCLGVCLIVLFVFGSAAAQVNVRLVTDEAEAVLSVLAKRKTNQTITETDWQRIFQSEGYVRLKKRETAISESYSRRTTRPLRNTTTALQSHCRCGPCLLSTRYGDEDFAAAEHACVD